MCTNSNLLPKYEVLRYDPCRDIVGLSLGSAPPCWP